MDADCDETRRDYISRREKRWSMNSQRLEEIVAELMKPIGDVRRSFDTDLSALLEEYLTEAGLHALEEDDSASACQSPILGSGAGSVPNFAELALLLQQSASIYGRKVDFLYQHVLNVSDNLQNNALEEPARADRPEGAEAGAAAAGRRKRKASAAADFARIELEPCAAATREDDAPRPPPTLPRLYVELEPRVLSSRDAQLTDYSGECIGVLADFHAAWRLQDGLLVEELQSSRGAAPPLRAVPLGELQAALSAAAPPPSPPPPPPLPLERRPVEVLPPSPAHVCSSPPPHGDETSTPPPPPPAGRRKRKSDGTMEVAPGTLQLIITTEMRRNLKRRCEFSLPGSWVAELVARRKNRILSERATHRRHRRDRDFRGFDESQAGGFPGWSASDAASANASLSLARDSLALADIAAHTGGAVSDVTAAPRASDSDDDGFFEQSSLGDSDASRVDESLMPTVTISDVTAAPRASDSDDDGFIEQSSLGDSDASRVDESLMPTSASPRLEMCVWQARAAAAAGAAEARGADISRLAARLLTALPGAAPRTFPAVLASAADHPTDVSRLFLATLFLANSGNVEIKAGAPLTLDTFSVRVLSRDRARYAAALAADLAPPLPTAAAAPRTPHTPAAAAR